MSKKEKIIYVDSELGEFSSLKELNKAIDEQENAHDDILIVEDSIGTTTADKRHEQAMKRAGIGGIHKVHNALEDGNVKRARELTKKSKMSDGMKQSIARVAKYY